jgi:hypothetical protein
MKGRTNQDLLLYALDLREALRLANEDKKGIQQWSDTRLNK